MCRPFGGCQSSILRTWTIIQTLIPCHVLFHHLTRCIRMCTISSKPLIPPFKQVIFRARDQFAHSAPISDKRRNGKTSDDEC